MKVIKLPQAYADLLETGEYIARNDLDAAAKALRLCRPICGKALLFRQLDRDCCGYAAASKMFQISRDTPAYFLTSVTNSRLPIFQKEAVKQIVAEAFDEARRSAGILIFACVIMLDHTHLLTDNAREMKEVLRFMNGISAKRIIDYVRSNGFESSLAKLRVQEREKQHKHSVYEHHPNAIRITGEDAFMKKVNYIHLNPVKERLVEHPDDYLYSSARQWHRRSLENEPLAVDLDKIKWRAAA